jgi:hypothetical protein
VNFLDHDVAAKPVKPHGDCLSDALFAYFSGAWAGMGWGDGWDLYQAAEPGCCVLGK